MILEQFPDLQALALHDKMLLVQELLCLIAQEEKPNPILAALIKRRLAEHAGNPDEGRTWEAVKEDLLKRALS